MDAAGWAGAAGRAGAAGWPAAAGREEPDAVWAGTEAVRVEATWTESGVLELDMRCYQEGGVRYRYIVPNIRYNTPNSVPCQAAGAEARGSYEQRQRNADPYGQRR